MTKNVKTNFFIHIVLKDGWPVRDVTPLIPQNRVRESHLGEKQMKLKHDDASVQLIIEKINAGMAVREASKSWHALFL